MLSLGEALGDREQKRRGVGRPRDITWGLVQSVGGHQKLGLPLCECMTIQNAQKRAGQIKQDMRAIEFRTTICNRVTKAISVTLTSNAYRKGLQTWAMKRRMLILLPFVAQ